MRVNPRSLHVVAAAGKRSADMFVFGQIGSDWFDEGITDKMVAEALGKLDGVDELNVHIDSPGGDAFQGIAIYNLLVNHPVKVNTIVQGWAASAASIIMQAGDSRRIAENGMAMIHNAWTFTIGNAAELRKQADMMDKLDANLALTYAARSGGKQSRFAELMAAETWFSAEEAMTEGLADEVIKAKEPADDVAASMKENAAVMRMKFAAQYRNAPTRDADTNGGFIPTERELEHYLRTLGCSKSVARTLVAKVFDDDRPGGMPGDRWDAGNVEPTVVDLLESFAGSINQRDLADSLNGLVKKIH